MEDLKDLLNILDTLEKSCFLLKKTLARLTKEYGPELIVQFTHENKGVTKDQAIECLQKSMLGLLEDPEKLSKEIPLFASSVANITPLDDNLFLSQVWHGDVYDDTVGIDAVEKLSKDMRDTARQDQKRRWFDRAKLMIPIKTEVKTTTDGANAK
jgi:hypothetical protein